MDGKRQRGSKAGKKRPKYVKNKGSLWQTEDVAVHTSLPPQVDGQLRCFCRLSITRIDWLAVKHPETVEVRVRWWGETGNGAVFRPENGKRLPEDGSKYRTVARYPVRSGPRQFAAYLADMSSLQLELITGRENDQVIGKADIHQISQLSPSMPIRGVFTVFSVKDEKIAELYASVVLESLMASYDSTGSIPTTDLSMTTRGSTADLSFPQKIPQPSPRPMEAISANHVFDSPETQKTRSRDEDSILRIASMKPIEKSLQPLEKDAQLSVTTSGRIVQTEANHRVGRNIEHPFSSVPVLNPSINTNVITNLLERGNRLREAMRTSSRGQPRLQDGSLGRIAVVNQQAPDWTGQSLNNLYANVAYESQDKSSADLELRAVDLVLGDVFPSNPFSHDNDMSMRSSFYSDIDIASDIGDPIHDADLLEQLFYHKEYDVSDISADDLIVESAVQVNTRTDLNDPGNIRPPSRHSSVTSLVDLTSPQKKNTEAQNSHNSKTKSKLSSKADNKASPKCEKRKSKTAVKTATPDKASRNRSISSAKSNTPKKRKSRPRTRSNSSQRSCSESMSDSKQKVQAKTRSRSRSNSKTKSRSKKNRGRLGRGSGSGLSDDDGEIQFTPRSDVSRVSFDVGNSDSDYKRARKSKNTASIDGISLDRLTLLGRVKFARVTAYSLSLDDGITSFNTKSLNKGRSPKAALVSKKQSTYFLEYQFPVIAALPERSSSGTMVTEVTRVASKNVKDNVVLFQHHSVFPVQFDGTALEQWWQSALIFRVFARNSPQDKVTTLGSCGIPLKDILTAENLVFTSELPIHSEKGLHGTAKGAPKPFIGALSILIELSSDSKDFTSFLAKTKLTEAKGGYKMVPIVQPLPGAAAGAGFLKKPPQSPMGLEAHRKLVHNTSENSKGSVAHTGQVMPISTSVPGVPISVNYQLPLSQHGVPNSDIEEGCLALNVLLVVAHGRNILLSSLNQQSAGIMYQDKSANVPVNVNTYLVCRMFWSRDAVTSPVCWGTADPQYSFMQIAPVLLTQSLFERMRDNVMVVEVWSKAAAGQHDKLIGLVKLSLHQFYMSFHDKDIAQMLLKSQYPVVAVDQYQPVIDLFSGQQSGDIHILLAMGSTKQIAALQALQMLSGTVKPHRPLHHLDAANRHGSNDAVQGVTSSVEHMFEISLNGVRGLRVFDTMIWGEADCFVQYQFPEQNKEHHDGQHHPESIGCSLVWNRGVTTLCVPDACFNDTKRHRISLPCDVPLQKVLLSACALSGQSSGVIPFEVWCRHYHPNTRDQVVAKAILPLAKVCAMVTMQKTGQVSTQTFSLPLTLVESIDSNQQSGVPTRDGDGRMKALKFQDSGLLDVTVSYRRNVIEQSDGEMVSASRNTVCLSIGVLRACGFKTAAELQVDKTSSMQYPAEVGVNAYVKVNCSFLHRQPGRITKTVARSFCPDFSHHLDFPCPLVFNTSSSPPFGTASYDDSDPISLAEHLEGGSAVMEVWHQVPRVIPGAGKERVNFIDAEVSNHEGDLEDILLGTVNVPLADLLTRKTGISGWYPIHPRGPIAGVDHNDLQRTGDTCIGGLELSVKFARQGDCDKVVNAARLIGWAPMNAVELADEADELENEAATDYALFSVAIDQALFPLANALRAGQTTLDPTARCYIRYKFYDKNAVLTPAHSLSDSRTDLLESRIRHKRHWTINLTAPLRWYLREEPIEIQVWLTYDNASARESHHPGNKDRLIGSAYVSMDAVLDPRRRHLGVSGQFPLFKPGAASLGGASVRVRLNLTTGSKQQMNEQADCNLSEEGIDAEANDHDDEYDPEDSFHHLNVKNHHNSKELEKSQVDEEGVSSFAVHVIIDQAMHLPEVLDRTSGVKCPPSTYVSFQTSDSATPTCVTDVVSCSKTPVWDFEVDTRLGTDLLQRGNKNLVFKVWHKIESLSKTAETGGDRVLGFTTVDLLPLTSGLSQLCGWYHIVDFGGQCQGQIKVGITPLEPLSLYATSTVSGQTDWPQDNKVWSPPCFTSNYASAIATDLPHFEEHYVNVKRHHESLHQQVSHQERTLHQHAQQIIASQLGQYTVREALHGQLGATRVQESYFMNPDGGANDEMLPSRSVLFTCLRKQLQELDDITVKLKSRLESSSEIHNADSQHQKEQYNDGIISMTQPYVSNVAVQDSVNSNLNNNNIITGQQQRVSSNEYVDDINRIASYSSDSSSVKHLPTQIFMASGGRQEHNTHHRPQFLRGRKKETHDKGLSENGYQSDDEDEGVLDDKCDDDDGNHQHLMSQQTYMSSGIVSNRNNNNNGNQLLSVQHDDTEHLLSEARPQEFHGMVKNLETDFDGILNLSQSFSESLEFTNKNVVGNVDFLTDSEDEMSGSDVDLVVPRALNSISGKDVDRAERIKLPQPREFHHVTIADDAGDLRDTAYSLPQKIAGSYSYSEEKSICDNDSDVENTDAWLPDIGSEIDAFRLRACEWETGKEDISQVKPERGAGCCDDNISTNKILAVSTDVHIVNRGRHTLQSNTEQEEDDYNSDHEYKNEENKIRAYMRNSDIAINLENTSDWSEPELPDNTAVENFSSSDDSSENDDLSQRAKQSHSKINEVTNSDNDNVKMFYQDNSKASEAHVRDPVSEIRKTDTFLRQDANNIAEVANEIEENSETFDNRSDGMKTNIDSISVNHDTVDAGADHPAHKTDQTVSEEVEMPCIITCDRSNHASLNSGYMSKDSYTQNSDKITSDSGAVSVTSPVLQNIATNNQDKPNSKARTKSEKFQEPAYPNWKVPDFFWSRDQLEQSLKSLQTGTTEGGQSLTRVQAKAQTAKERMHRLASSGNHASSTAVLKQKPLPTDEERQRIARIFKTKFS